MIDGIGLAVGVVVVGLVGDGEVLHRCLVGRKIAAALSNSPGASTSCAFYPAKLRRLQQQRRRELREL